MPYERTYQIEQRFQRAIYIIKQNSQFAWKNGNAIEEWEWLGNRNEYMLSCGMRGILNGRQGRMLDGLGVREQA